ncbi:zinc ribbon domain-containing protein [Methylotuvimicrobium sp. KM2]|uniref:zinc ribbon domain-containing protein n=1 Tax=Methylotuvimicrobium sp. KM2 TaxID=3133976 RepID=UPI0031016868
MELVFCMQCGQKIPSSAHNCPHCGAQQTLAAASTSVPPQAASLPASALPEGIKGWSWGAFWLSWVWAIFNKTWIGLMALIPLVNLVMMVILGLKGREWAWRNKAWPSVEHFNRVQKKWSLAGWIIMVASLILGIAIGVIEDRMKHRINGEFDTNWSLTASKHSEQSDSYRILAESVPAAPIMSYEQLIVSNGAVGDTFSVQPLEYGNAINYLSRAGVINILEYVVEYPDATGYVAIEKAYSFGTKYVLIVSTGEGGASCPATTYAIAFDSKTESVTGKVEIDGCSENIESLSDGNKLIVKKDGAASVFFNGEVKQATHSPMISTDVTQSTSQESPGEAPAQHNEKKKMMGDIIDDNPNARPNGEDELKNKLQRKPWQDENGFIHYPDGSVTNSPVD